MLNRISNDSVDEQDPQNESCLCRTVPAPQAGDHAVDVHQGDGLLDEGGRQQRQQVRVRFARRQAPGRGDSKQDGLLAHTGAGMCQQHGKDLGSCQQQRPLAQLACFGHARQKAKSAGNDDLLLVGQGLLQAWQQKGLQARRARAGTQAINMLEKVGPDSPVAVVDESDDDRQQKVVAPPACVR